MRAKLKRWGNSYGVIVPKVIIKKEGLKEGDTVEILVRKTAYVRRLFGKYRFKGLQAHKDAMKKGWASKSRMI